MTLLLTPGCRSLPIVQTNEHRISERAYRSAQLSSERLEDYLNEKRIDHAA